MDAIATRRERVVLELEDAGFTSGMARAAAQTALLKRELNSLSGTAVRSASRDLNRVSQDIDKTGTSAERNGKQIDRLSGRLALLAQAAAVLGPALLPIGAATIPAIAGLTGEVGALAGALGVTLLAFNGLGDGIKALNDYQLEPTQQNLEKVREEFKKLGPDGAHFLMFLDKVEPQLKSIQFAAREGLFPGVEDGITALLPLLPQVRTIVSELAHAMGDLASDAGANLAGPKFREFFDYLDREAAPILSSLGRAVGNFGAGLGNLLVEFSPLATGFTDGLEEMARAFADWSAGLDDNAAFQDFLDYLGDSGPQVLDLLGSLVGMLVNIAKAAAPVGDVVVPALTALAKVIGAIADSPIGTVFFAAAAGISVYSRAADAAAKSTAFLAKTAGTRGMGWLSNVGLNARTAAVGLGMVALASTDLDDQLGVSNTLMLGTAGIMAGPWGAAIGAGVGALLDLKAANSDVTDELAALNQAMDVNNAADLEEALQGVREEMEHGEGLAEGLKWAWDLLSGRTDRLSDALGRGERRLRMLNDAAGRVEGIDSLLGVPLGLSREFDVATDSMDQFTQSFKRLNNLLSDRDTLIAYNQALDDLAAKIREGNGFDVGTDKGREGLQALNDLVQTAIDRSEKLKEAGKDLGAVRILNRAIDDLKNFGNQSPAMRRAARDMLAELKRLNEGDARPRVELDDSKFRIKSDGTLEDLFRIDGFKAKPKVDSDTRPAMSKWDKLFGLGKDLDHFTANPKVKADTSQAMGALGDVQSALGKIVSKSITVTANVVRNGLAGLDFAEGGYTGPGDKYKPAGIVHAGEVVIPQRYVKRDWSLLKARYGDLPGFADGGVVGAHRTLDDQLAIAQVMQQIRELKRSLAKDGKDKLDGLNRRIAELQLRAAEKELQLAKHREEREARADAREKLQERRSALRDVAAGFSLDSVLPAEELSFSQQVRAEIDSFKQDILDAGGVWTKEMRGWAKDLMATAHRYQATQAAIEAETKKRDALVETLSGQQSQLDDLNRTMEAFGAQVASNFLNDPFNQHRTRTVAGTPGAASAALAQAQAQLAAIQAGSGPGAAAQASRLMQQIALLQDAAAAETAPVEQTVTGLDALRETLQGDTTDALAFAAALQQLVTEGLDPTGGLYQQLAGSRDIATAQQLAGLTPAEIDEFEAMFKAREDAAAQLAAMTTQAVYGEQQAQLQASIDQTTAAIRAVDLTLALLNATQAVLGEQVRVGSEAAAALINPQLAEINKTLAGLPDATVRDVRQLLRQLGVG